MIDKGSILDAEMIVRRLPGFGPHKITGVRYIQMETLKWAALQCHTEESVRKVIMEKIDEIYELPLPPLP